MECPSRVNTIRNYIFVPSKVYNVHKKMDERTKDTSLVIHLIFLKNLKHFNEILLEVNILLVTKCFYNHLVKE